MEENGMPKVVVMALILAVALCITLVFGAATVRAGNRVIDFTDMDVNSLMSGGFEVTNTTKAEVVGVGAKMFSYGWIIDAKSREVVWTMYEDCDDPSSISDALYECRTDLTLSPGRYEAYYFVGEINTIIMDGNEVTINDLGDVIDLLGKSITFSGGDIKHVDEEDLAELSFTVTIDGTASTSVPKYEPPAGMIVSFHDPERDEYYRQGFTLSKETDLAIYAIGEYSDSYNLFVDGGWILNADTREKVWTMDRWNTDWAEGARKNRYFKGEITLPAGNYIACYITDDSHDPGQWNSAPPGDPLYYGLTISTVNPADSKTVSAFNEKDSETQIVAITRVRNSEYEKKAFTLRKSAKIHIYALGERSNTKDDLTDFGWIVNADNMEKVWEMTADNTDFAGGASKNVQFDGIIELPPGNYIVHYRSDDSHAYGSWNAAKPINYADWGITLSGVGKEFSAGDFQLVDGFAPTGDMLVNLTGLGDDEDVEQTFTISKPTKVRIVALGEGRSDEMFDYGWIEKEPNGRTIWEMDYHDTRFAGGDSKNRIAIETIELQPGKYTAHFVTDGSHSFQDFNASPPDDPERWGITVTVR